MSRKARNIILLFLLFVFSSAPCYIFAAESLSGKYPGYNVIMIIVDCLRADHLGCYGYTRNTSPNIDKFAAKNLVFTQAITQAPTTLLSFASFLTSQHVSKHGAINVERCLSDDALTLPEVLKIYNYQTAAFLGGLLLNPVYRLNQGFDTYDYKDDLHSSFSDTFPNALTWAKECKEKGKKFFILLHGNDLHTPYPSSVKPVYDTEYRGKFNNGKMAILDTTLDFYPQIYKKKYFNKPVAFISIDDKDSEYIVSIDDKDSEYIVASYDTQINHADDLVGKFLSELEISGVLDKTIVILTADHGEGLFDHDYFFHEFNLYETTIRVPLIIKIPGCNARTISSPVQLIDLMPTILDLLRIKSNNQMEGRSIVSLFSSEHKAADIHKYIFTESTFGATSIRSNNRWKFIKYPDRIELFDLNKDPNEQVNLFDRQKKIVIQLHEVLDKWYEKESHASGKKTPVVVPSSRMVQNVERRMRVMINIIPKEEQRLKELSEIEIKDLMKFLHEHSK